MRLKNKYYEIAMKVAIIKQQYDAQGPWQGVKWQDTTPEKIFDIWPGTITFWGLSCLLKPDWYVVRQGKLKSDYVIDILKNSARTRIMEKYAANLTDIEDIPLDDYDLVITLDPILEIPLRQAQGKSKKTKTLFAYFVPEHWDRLYNKSIRKPLGDFDLFLAVMLEPQAELVRLPQSVAFPYPCDPEVTRELFRPAEKREAAWAEWRLLCALGMTNLWNKSAAKAVERLEKVLGLPVVHRGNFHKTPMGIADPPLWGDAARYLRALGACKYYIAVGRYSGPGQGIREAASLECICIGEADKPYHQMVCHPEALCQDMVSMPKVLKKISSSASLQQEIIAHQNKMLQEKFAKEPMAILQKAVEMKKNMFKT